MREIIIKRNTYRHWRNNKELFDLELVFNESTQVIYLKSSNIPRWILEEIQIPEEELTRKGERFDQAKAHEVLERLAKKVLVHPYASRHFFPSSWLNKNGQVIKEKLYSLENAQNTIRAYEIQFVTVVSEAQCFYLNSLYYKALAGVDEPKILSCEEITRKEWEKHLLHEYQIESYIEIFKEIKSFIKVTSNGLDPGFVGGLNSKQEVIIAYIQHSKVINV